MVGNEWFSAFLIKGKHEGFLFTLNINRLHVNIANNFPNLKCLFTLE